MALTFDDGPNPTTTNQALDTLSKYGIKATFFVLGKNVSGNEEILKRMKADGHVIGNHSWSHPRSFQSFRLMTLKNRLLIQRMR